MNTLRCVAETFLLGFLLALFSNSAVFAETVNCTAITSVPVTITTEGIYCLKSHLTSAVNNVAAIRVDADDVVIDLNGFTLGGLGGPVSTAIGISVVGHMNTTIKNGTVRGFFIGIFIGNTLGSISVVEEIRAEQNGFVGIEIAGRQTRGTIRNNHIVATAGAVNAFGIRVTNTGDFSSIRVINNDVIDTSATNGTPTGIDVAGCCAVVEGNRIINNTPPNPRGSFGINMGRTGDSLVVNNRISFMTTGINAEGSTKIRDNLTIGVQNPFQGGIDAGNNN